MREIIVNPSIIDREQDLFAIQTYLDSVKRQSLFFDLIVVVDLDKFLELLKGLENTCPTSYKERVRQLIHEFYILVENEIICGPRKLIGIDTRELERTIKEDIEQLESNFSNERLKFFKFKHNDPFYKGNDPGFKLMGDPRVQFLYWDDISFWILKGEYFARKISEKLNKDPKIISTYHTRYLSDFSDISKSKRTDLLEASILDIPLPDPSTEWERILELRNDSILRERLLGFKVWLSEMSYSKLSIKELIQKLEYTKVQYENQLELHSLKHQNVILNSITKVSEALLNLISGNIIGTSKNIVDLNKKRLSLLESEYNLKGKEVAYLIDLNQKIKTPYNKS